jgi:hypothetical protein
MLDGAIDAKELSALVQLDAVRYVELLPQGP